jgi:4-carboxymuconolactone decarboxylase
MSEGPRIPPVVDPTPDQAVLLEKTLFPGVKAPLNVFATLAHHPHLLKRVNALGGLFMAHPTIPARDRELMILRVAVRCQCSYELAQHLVIGGACGLTEDELERIRLLDDRGWGEEDALLLSVVDALIDDDDIGDPQWALLARRFGDAQLLEVIFLVGFYRMIAGYLRSVRVAIDGG